ncbi:MAG: hypothetical protein COA79_21210 [Planctomycetota bacterium]|nr:MAG: hypothetical protein COA79_21210 [Planctomycetota bacterium]
MVKKLLNPIVVCVFILMLVCIGHLMYGRCQTSKYHYMCQAHWMPRYLPKGMIKYIPEYWEIDKYFLNYTGTWRSWYEDGEERGVYNFKKGYWVGKSKEWYLDGRLHSIIDCNQLNKTTKFEQWYKNGNKSFIKIYRAGKYISKVHWNKDGSLNMKEYYDTKGNSQKRELFEKGKLVGTEVVE